MKQRFKEGITPKNFIALLSVLTILFGIGAIFFFDFLILPLASFFALLLWFAPKSKLLCASISLALIAVSFLGGVRGVFSVCAGLCCGLILGFMYRARLNKTDTVLAMTAFFVVYLLLALFLSVAGITKEYSIDSVTDYLGTFLESQKVALIDLLSDFYVTDENGVRMYLFSRQDSEEMLLSVARLSVSYLVVAAFTLCGLVCKIFSRMVAYAERDDAYIRAWRFLPSRITAYFYILLVVLSFLTGSGESVFGGSVQNLLVIFMAVFAYIGVRHLIFVAAQAKRRGYSLLVIGFLLILLNVSAVQILSFLGTYVTIISNRVSKE